MAADKILATIEDIGDIVVAVVGLVKGGVIGIGGVEHLFEVLGDVRSLVTDGMAALPELSQVDAAEAGQMAQAAYTQVQRIVAAVAGGAA